MRKILFISAIALSCNAFSVTAAPAEEVDEYNKVTNLGFAAYQAKKYNNAFKYLEQASKLGNKEAQFILAGLYMNGQGVSQDYAKAYLWLNVAAEANEKKWRKVKEQMQNALSEQQRNALQSHVSQYLAQYGEQSQDVSCKRRTATGTSRRTMTCVKTSDIGTSNARRY